MPRPKKVEETQEYAIKLLRNYRPVHSRDNVTELGVEADLKVEIMAPELDEAGNPFPPKFNEDGEEIEGDKIRRKPTRTEGRKLLEGTECFFFDKGEAAMLLKKGIGIRNDKFIESEY